MIGPYVLAENRRAEFFGQSEGVSLGGILRFACNKSLTILQQESDYIDGIGDSPADLRKTARFNVKYGADSQRAAWRPARGYLRIAEKVVFVMKDGKVVRNPGPLK